MRPLRQRGDVLDDTEKVWRLHSDGGDIGTQPFAESASIRLAALRVGNLIERETLVLEVRLQYLPVFGVDRPGH